MTTLTESLDLYMEDAEKAVVGSVLVDPSVFVTLNGLLAPSDFFLLRHRELWAVYAGLDKAKTPIDFVTVQTAVKALGKTDSLPGSYLLGLVNDTPTASNAETYAHLIKRAAVRRQLLEAADAIKALATSKELPTEAVMEQASSAISNVSALSVSEYTGMAELVDRHMERTEKAMEHPGTLAGIPSVIPALGKTLGGYQPGRVYIYAARPGMGKTSFLVSETLAMAQQGYRVAFQSLEMTEDDLMTSLIAVASGVPAKVIKEATMTPAQYTAYVKAAGAVAKLPIWIDDKRVTPKQMGAKVRSLAFRKGVDVLMADYLQLFKAPAGVKNEAYDRVTEISIQLTELAKTLKVPLLVASQLSRKVEDRSEKRPQLSDLRESGQIEQDAWAVMFPFRPSVYGTPMDIPPMYEEAEIAIAKNREGPTGMVRCIFLPVLKQFAPSNPVHLAALEGKTA